MPKIHVLEKHVAELIAAGEVVDRPASVIKELVENSVDAGASVITVEMKNGGITFMRVTDNGCGIAPEDVANAFVRHATSKVFVAQDLDKIGTLGFRGEALASIGAVSHIELLTRVPGAQAGTQYCSDGGQAQPLCEIGCPVGTTILVRDIFYNTPARMKFLKKDVVEGNAIAAVLDKIALSHPEISLRLIRDGKETLHTPGDNQLRSAIYAVFGKEFLSGLIPVEYKLDGVEVTGYVSKPSAARANRAMQHYFINGRTVRSRTAMVALEEAFKSSIMVGKFPACVLHLSIACETVDVNVHPSQLEVRFADERPVFNAVYHGVKSALERSDTPKEMNLPQKPYAAGEIYADKTTVQQTELPVMPAAPVPAATSAAQRGDGLQGLLSRVFGGEQYSPSAVLRDSAVAQSLPGQAAPPRQTGVQPLQNEVLSPKPALDAAMAQGMAPPQSLPVQEPPVPQSQQLPVQNPAAPQAQPHPAENSLQDGYAAMPMPVILGEAFSTYIIAQCGDELLLIDKHAAHERMLYEKLKAGGGGMDAQTLLQPRAVTLEKQQYSAVLENISALASIGFDVEDFGSGTVMVRSAPLMLSGDDVAACLDEIADNLVQNKTELLTEKMDWIYHNVACRAAIKAGNTTSLAELTLLAARLHSDPSLRYCPHGRPIFVALKKREIEKQFGRI